MPLEQVGNKDRFKAEQDAVEVELKAESMVSILRNFLRCVIRPNEFTIRTPLLQVRATESLLSLSHTLKLLFLLDNEDEGSVKIVEVQQEHALAELAQIKKEASQMLGEVLSIQ